MPQFLAHALSFSTQPREDMASQVKVAKPEGENNHKNEEQAGKYFKIYLYDTLYTVAKFGEKWLL